MKKLNNEELLEECVLAFNAAGAKANEAQARSITIGKGYKRHLRRWERINQAKEQIREMLEKDRARQTSGIIFRSIYKARFAFANASMAFKRVKLANEIMANAFKREKKKQA